MRRESSRHLRRIDRGELRTDPNFQALPAGSYAESSTLEAWNPLRRAWDGHVLYVLSRAMFRVRRAHEAIGIPSLHRVPTNHWSPRATATGRTDARDRRSLQAVFVHTRGCCAPRRLLWCTGVSSPAVLRGSCVRRGSASVGLPRLLPIQANPSSTSSRMACSSDPPPPFFHHVTLDAV